MLFNVVSGDLSFFFLKILLFCLLLCLLIACRPCFLFVSFVVANLKFKFLGSLPIRTSTELYENFTRPSFFSFFPIYVFFVYVVPQVISILTSPL